MNDDHPPNDGVPNDGAPDSGVPDSGETAESTARPASEAGAGPSTPSRKTKNRLWFIGLGVLVGYAAFRRR